MKRPYKALRRLIEDADMQQGEFAERIGMVASSLSGRMTGKIQWTGDDIRAVCRELGIPRGEIGEYFFPDVADPADAEVTGTHCDLPPWLAGRSA